MAARTQLFSSRMRNRRDFFRDFENDMSDNEDEMGPVAGPYVPDVDSD